MATQSKTSPAEQINQAFEGLLGLNEKVLAGGKKAHTALLDSYEKGALTFAGTYEEAAAATNVEWIGAIASAQAQIGRELTSAYVDAARELVS